MSNHKDDINPACGLSELTVKNWSTIASTSHKIQYLWIIHNYRFHHKKGDDLRSPTFTADTNTKCKWYLKINPDGKSECKDYVALFLYLDSSSECDKVFAEYKFSIIDHRQIEVISKQSDEILEYSLPSETSWGKVKFIKKSDILNDNLGLLSNGTLRIYCEVTFSQADVSVISSADQFDQTFSQHNRTEHGVCADFEQLLENQLFTDVIMSVNGQDYKAHRLILAARSPVFAAMFNCNMKENEQNRVVITDLSNDATKEILRYIYTGRVENLENLYDELLMAADKYDLKGLKAICEQTILKNLTIENAAETLVLADLHRANGLKSKTIGFIVSNCTRIINTDDWEKVVLSSSNFKLINEVCEALSNKLATCSCNKIFSMERD